MKNTRLLHALIFLFGLASWLTQPAMAVPADPAGHEVTQPDGAKFTVHLRGDEFFSWHETEDGYAVDKDADGFWKYSKPAAGKAEFRAIKGARVGSSDPARLGVKKHDLPERAVLQKQVGEYRRAILGVSAESETAPGETVSTQGGEPPLDEPPPEEPPHYIPVHGVKSVKNIVILACFSDQWDSASGTVSTNFGRVDIGEYSNLFDQVGYSADGAAGSVKDYYREVSYGKLTLDSIVTMWVQLPREEAYYGSDAGGGHGTNQSKMTTHAIQAAAEAGFDFSQGDMDGDSWVDCLTVIHSGYDQAAGASSNAIWSHKGAISSLIATNGVKMYMYHTESALRGTSGAGITRIGTACHELGHFFGLPDLYDYSPLTDGLGNWCLMSGASWSGSSGTTPGHPSAWAKVFLGFARTVPVHSKLGLSLPRVEDNAVVGMLRDGTTNGEYFLVENRAKIGFDNSTQMKSGLLVYHVDQKNANNDLGTWTHPAVKIEEADGNDSLGTGGGGTEAGDAWTSTSGLTGGWRDQTDSQSANAMLYQPNPTTNIAYSYNRSNEAASYTYNRLSNVSAAGSNMTFDVQTLKTDAPVQSAIPTNFTVSWAAASEAVRYEIQEGTNATLTAFSDAAESEAALYDNWHVHGKTFCAVTSTSHGGSACYALLQGNYGSVQSLVLRKPIKVTTNTVISFYLMSHMSVSNGYLKCELSSDNGDTWNTLGAYNGYIDPWSLRSYVYTNINNAGINAGETCLLRFVVDIEYVSGWSAFPKYGFALDDISITGTEIAGYDGWTTLDNNVTTNSYPIASKANGVYAYRIQAYANSAWQGYGAVGETTVRSNLAPVWIANPSAGADANVGADYNADLGGLVTDESNDTLTFSKVSGPAWLTVNSNGAIAGTPHSGDAGLNSFTIRATDLAGAYSDVTLNIFVRIPFAQWRLNELAGPTMYDSISSFHGTAQGNLVYGQSGVPGAAAGNAAIQVNGTNTAVSIPALNLLSNTVTITAMIKCNGVQGSYPGIVGWSSGGTTIAFGLGYSNNYLTYIRNGSVYNSSSVVVPTSEWAFVALVLTPGSSTIYMATNAAVASADLGRTDPADPIFTNSGYLCRSSYGRFTGTVDEVTIYNQALNASQIGQLAATAFTPVPHVTMISPAAGATYFRPATFDITAAIVSNGHDVSKAQFYSDSTLLAEVATLPYSTTVTNLTNGVYAFSVTAVYDGGNSISSMTVTTRVINAPPVCAADAATTLENTPVTIPVLANDSDPYGLTLSIQSVTQPARGTVAIAGTNVTYTPRNYWYGLDSFTYTAFDGVDSTATGTVTVTTPFPNHVSAYTSAVVAAGPVAYWRLNESGGTNAYDSVGARRGTNNGSVVVGISSVGAPTFPGFESGNTAYQFSSNSANATSVAVPALNLNTNTITITAWLKRDGMQPTNSGIFAWRPGSGNGAAFRVSGDGVLVYSWNGFVYTSTRVVPNDQWTFVALVVGPTNAMIYSATNSTLGSWTRSGTNDVAAFDSKAYIGYDSGSTVRRFNGLIDEVAVFNQSLTPTQISNLLLAAQTAVPAVELTTPTNGSAFAAGASIPLAASVTSNGNHTIEKVQFIADATNVVAEVQGGPYTSSWSSAGSGGHTILARLLYDGGGTNDSAPVSITQEAPVLRTLTIVSGRGAAVPASGIYTNADGTGLTNLVIEPAAAGGTQFVCLGWSMAGNEPQSGGTTSMVMTVTNDATLTWLWNTNYWLETAAGSKGSVNVASGWRPAGVTTQITATAAAYYHFTNWSGSVSSSVNPLDLLMDSPRSVVASFTENTATNGTPEWWLAQYGWTSDFDSAETNDSDHDGMKAWQEFLAGTDPTNEQSLFQVRSDMLASAPAGYIITWTSATNRFYEISWKTNLLSTPSALVSDLPGVPPLNQYTDAVHNVEQTIYYRIQVRQ